jgi:gp32 DNA binding protein like
MAINHDKLKKTRAGSRAGTGWRPREGSNKVRILPPHSRYIDNWDALEDFAIKFKMHFLRVQGRMAVSRCLQEVKQKCPACDLYWAHKDSSDPALVELAKGVRAADQYLFNVLDLSNLQSGIQPWSANYTCWDKIMELGANPAWGNIIDPANGINFDISMTPGTRSRTGFNQYGVTPEPQYTTVMEVLESIPDWKAQLDALVDQIPAPLPVDELVGILAEIGFPSVQAGQAQVTAPVAGAPRAVNAPGAAPLRAAAPVPVGAPAVAGPRPVAVSVPGAAPAAGPRPVAVRPAAPAPAVAARNVVVDGDDEQPEPDPVAPAPVRSGGKPSARATAPVAVAAHYDPGPEYVPVVEDHARPADAPRCYGDYRPDVHRCEQCPKLADCQMRTLGIE